MILYNYYRSSASYRVRLALELKQLTYEYRPIHLLKGEQSNQEYRQLNPLQQVPALIHDQRCLTQSMAICLYLDTLSSVTPLLPKESYESATIVEFCEIINCTQPLQNLSTLNYLTADLMVTTEQKDHWLNRWLKPSLQSIEIWLSKNSGQYCFKDQPTLADCFFLPQIFTTRRFEISLESYPNILRLEQGLNSLNWVQKAHPNNQIDTPK